jgi:hypothetical protein
VTDFHKDDDGDIAGGRVRETEPPYGPVEPRMLLTIDVDDHIEPERQVLLRLIRTTAGNYNISIDLLRRIRIPVPEPRLQQEYSAIVARARDTLSRTEVSVQKSSDVSASLMCRLLRWQTVALRQAGRGRMGSVHDTQDSMRGA